jgi:quinol monooxygenase YgiN
MLHVIAIITSKPGQRAAVLAAHLDNVAQVRAEVGCIEYGPTVDIEGAPSVVTLLGPDTFVGLEKWESREALFAHAASDHYKAYLSRVKDMVVSRVIHVLDPVSAA